MQPIGNHAVVLGASMAGLAAARVLADAYQRVTVLERDALPPAAAHRRGVPQSRHARPQPPTAGASPRAATPTRCWPAAGPRWRSCSLA